MREATKWCPDCREDRPVEAFYVNAARRDGLSGYCIEHHLAHSRAHALAKRLALIEAMGGQCEGVGLADCPWGVTDHRCLQIDHVHGTGRNEIGNRTTAKFYAEVLTARDEFALLCANCNQVKKHEQNETVGDRVYVRQVPTERKRGPGKGSADGSREAIARARTSEHQAAAGRAKGRLSDDQVRDIRARRPGATLRDIAASYDISPPLVSAIVARTAYAHVADI